MLNKLKKFKEYNLIEPADVILNREKNDEIKDSINYFNSNKSKIDILYGREDISNINDELKKIINDNTLLLHYATLKRIERQIENMNQKNAEDKIKKDDFNSQLSTLTDKTATQNKIKEIDDRIIVRNKELIELKKELDLKAKENKEELEKIKKSVK